MRNLFLIHFREHYDISPRDIQKRTGIPCQRYLAYEESRLSLSTTDMELLATLFGIREEYLSAYCHQLEFFTHTSGILDLKDERIRQLTRALKQKIKKTPLPPAKRSGKTAAPKAGKPRPSNA